MLMASLSLLNVHAGEKLVADVPHCRISFTVPFLKYATQGGVFPDLSIELVKGAKDFSGSTVTFSANINALNTNEPERDEHLRGEPFFNAAKYPTLSFSSTSFTALQDNNFLMKGNLTLKGITRPATFNVSLKGEAKDPMTQEHLYIFSVSGTVSRLEFGIGKEYPDFVIGDKIQLDASVILKADATGAPQKEHQ